MQVIILTLFTLSVFANTQFFFERDQSNSLQGKCYEIDSKTMGKNFKIKAPIKKCKPLNTSYSFSPQTGKCYVTDTETNGYKYIESTSDTEKCKTENVEIGILKINRVSACYEFDVKSKGKSYYKKLSSKQCLDKTDSFVWKQKKELSGECFQVGKSGALNKVKKKHCRPEKVNYIFKKGERSFFKGTCYEVHPKGLDKYSLKIKTIKCKPLNTVYIFYTKEGSQSGKCYEVDTPTRGVNYINIVKDLFCKENI